MDSALMGRVIDALAETLGRHGEELTRLDQALLGGTLGTGLARAAAEIRANRRSVATMELENALEAVATSCKQNLDEPWSDVFANMVSSMAKAAPSSDDLALAQTGRALLRAAFDTREYRQTR